MNARSRSLAIGISSFFAATLVAAVLTRPAPAGDCTGLPPIDGRNLRTKYAQAPSVLQDNPTGFGDHALPPQEDTEGSELNRMFAAYDSTHLHVGITGNTPRDDADALRNTVLLFLDVSDQTAAQSVLNTSGATAGSGALMNMSGVQMDNGFTPDYVVELWNVAGVFSGVLYDLTAGTAVSATPLTEGVEFAVDNTNLTGVNAEPSNDPLLQQQNAASATTGFQFRLALNDIDLVAGSSVDMQSLIVNRDGYISNQCLPPLRPTQGQTGGNVGCIGIHNPAEGNTVDFNAFIGNQYVTFSLTGPTLTPSSFTGQNLAGAFGNNPPLAVQNNYTCFGDAAPYTPGINAGSELNQFYVTSDFTNLYIGLTGNVPINDTFGNTVIVFIETPNPGLNTLATTGVTSGSGAVREMNGVQLDGTPGQPDGFRPRYAIQYWRENGAHNAVLSNIVNNARTDLLFSIDQQFHVTAGNAYVVNLSNVDGVNNIPGDDPLRQHERALTAHAGMLFSVRLNTLGISNPFATVRVMACIVSRTGFISNQFLPALNPTGTPLIMTDTFTPSLPLADEAMTSDTQDVTATTGFDRVTGIEVTVNLTHPDVSELTIDLQHVNSARMVRLWNRNAAGGAMNTTFAEGGADLSTWVAPGVGTFQPHESLLTFNGVDPTDGPWRLVITDHVAGNTGTLVSWTLQIRDDPGGNIGCIGEHNAIPPVNEGDPPLNIVDLNAYPGDQYLTLALDPTQPPYPVPDEFTGTDIPAAFDDDDALNAMATQNNHTCFGDATLADTSLPSPGSELDQMFVTNTNDRLKVALTGNLEANGNAVVLLLDTVPGGNQTITGITPPPTPIGGADGLNGLILDTGFNPDYAVVVHRDAQFPVPAENNDVFITNLTTNFTRKIGYTVRDSGSGVLADAVASYGGNELDLMFVQNDADRLYVGLTGNINAEGGGNGDVFVVFLDTAPGGSNILSTNFPGYFTGLRNMNGDRLDAAMQPEFAIAFVHTGLFTFNAQLIDLTTHDVTALTYQNTIGDNVFFADNGNGAGVTGQNLGANDATQQAINAQSALKGVQFAIARSDIGNPTNGTNIRVCAVLAGGSGFWSNQTLPGVGGAMANLGNNANLDAVAGDQYATYTIASSGSAPAGFDAADIPGYMGGVGAAVATQNNYTGFGDNTLPNPGNPNCTQVAFDDTNFVGVTNNSADDADTADTGFEFDVAFGDIGLTPGQLGTVKLMAVVTGRHGYLSNQFLPPLGVGNAGNLAFADGVNLGDFPGDQFLTYELVESQPRHPADINDDGVVDNQDVLDFVGVLLGTNTDEPDVTNSDFNNSGTADGDDVQPFVDALYE